jgi:hypothetical protein
MPDSMGTVAGVDEAGQTPQVADQTQQTANKTQPADGSESRPEQARETTEPSAEKPGFAERGQMRRRARFLRKARELAYRDLGGLVFDLHRFGQRNDPLVLAKLAMLRQLDTELRELERVLRERRPVTVLREVGIAACPRCAAIHGSDDRFCPGCGLAFDANADRPISTMPMAPQGQAQAQAPNAQPLVPTQASVSTAAPTQNPAPVSTPAPATARSGSTFVPSGSTFVSAPINQAPSPTPPSTPTQAPEREQPRPADDEQTQILRPPVRDE